MANRKLGVAARDLTDDALKRELSQMWRTREETIMRGSAHAIATHTSRMLELEHELIARFPKETQAAASRTRRGSRAQNGQPVGRQGARTR